MPGKKKKEETYDEFDDAGKTDRTAVNYRASKSGELEQCSLCENWLGHRRTRSHSMSTGACALIAGSILQHNICDLYEKGSKFYERHTHLSPDKTLEINPSEMADIAKEIMDDPLYTDREKMNQIRYVFGLRRHPPRSMLNLEADKDESDWE